MKKSILNLGIVLNKADQKTINGGMNCPSSPICYGINIMQCGTCAEYHALPRDCKMRVLVSVDCFGI